MSNGNGLAFIIGTGRCGSTMLAQILNAHSKVYIPPELQLIFGYSGNGPRLYEYFVSGDALRWSPQDFIRKVGELCPHRFDCFFDYKSFFLQQKYPIDDLGCLLSDLYEALAASNDKLIFLEQTPWYGQRLDIMTTLFPQAKYIHMVRDGRDVALSFARTPWWYKSPTANLERWGYEITKIVQDAKALLGSDRYLEVRYEDFVADPLRMSTLIVNFLGVSFEDGMLSPGNFIDYLQFRKFDGNGISSSAFTKWNVKKGQAVFSDNVFGWKASSRETFVNLSAEVRAALAKFGYET